MFSPWAVLLTLTYASFWQVISAVPPPARPALPCPATLLLVSTPPNERKSPPNQLHRISHREPRERLFPMMCLHFPLHMRVPLPTKEFACPFWSSYLLFSPMRGWFFFLFVYSVQCGAPPDECCSCPDGQHESEQQQPV